MKKIIKNHAANSKGFSLVEILVTIAIIGVMAAITMPAVLSQLAHLRFTRDVRDLSIELGAARMNAISKNKRHSILVTLSGSTPDTYVTQTCTTVVGAACTVWATDTSRSQKSMTMDSNITSPGANFRVEFLPTGSATATDITIRNTSSATEQMIINVNAATGRITVT